MFSVLAGMKLVGCVVLSYGYPRTDNAGRRGASVATPVWNRANDGADHRQALIYSVGPGTNDVAFVVINPFLTTDDAFALEANRERIAIGDRAGQFQRPSGVEDLAFELIHRRRIDANVAASELEAVEVSRQVGIVEKAAIDPGANEDSAMWFCAHVALLQRKHKS